MKYWIKCSKCGEEYKVYCGTGKYAEWKYDKIKDDYICDCCVDKMIQEDRAKQQQELLDGGWKKITVHYSVYKNEYEGLVNVRGEKVQKGEYHEDDKTIDLIVPEGKLLKLTNSELKLLKREGALVLSGETEEEFQAKKSELISRFNDDDDTVETEDEDEVVEEEQEEEPVEVETKKSTSKKSSWNSIVLNDCHIVHTGEKAIKVAMPDGSGYEGWYFWHPRKCFDGMCMYFTDDWKFELQANGGVLKQEITAREMLRYEIELAAYEIDVLHTLYYTPVVIDPMENPQPDEELVDND